MYQYEGIFRRPRLWSNKELKKLAPIFNGSVINVSAWKDKDKSVSYIEYILGDYDEGKNYKDYFENASHYGISNYPSGDYKGEQENPPLDEYDYSYKVDLETDTIPEKLQRNFDVVFSHTVLEHVFDVFKAFENLCKMSNDVVILVVPFTQQVHYNKSGYKDYWRFTPFTLDKMFQENGFKVIYRSSNNQFQSSIYYLYVASRKPDKWSSRFDVKNLSENISQLNTARNLFLLSKVQIKIEQLLRKAADLLGLSKHD